MFILVDVRCSARQLHFLGRTARSTLGLGSWTLSSPSRGMTPGAPCARSDLVGGQLIMVSPRLGGSIRTSHPDPTGLGILTEFVIGTQGGDIQIMGTYFPCPSTHTVGPTNRLWDKTQAWLGGRHIAESLQQYLQRQIQTRSLRHLSTAATGDSPLRNISLIGGDFNATWDGHHGPLRGLGHWAATSSLLSPLAALTSTTPMASFYQGGAPKSLIDHILLTQPCQGRIARGGILTGSYFSNISDHRPVLLGLTLWDTALPAQRADHALSRPPTRTADLDLTRPETIQAYQDHIASLIPPGPPTADNASAELQRLSLASAAWAATRGCPDGHRKRRPRRKHFDGWSSEALALKANLMAVTRIQGHIRGYRGHRLWRTQTDMDQDLPGILTLWQTTVTSFQWDNPADPHRFMDKTGYGPSAWRTAQLREIHHPMFCTTLLKKIKSMLHGRLRHNLRLTINAHVAHLEQMRLQGKIGRVIRSTLQEDVDLFTLESLRTPDGTLTDHREIHHRVTEHFRLWYQHPPTASPPWTTLCTDQHAFLGYADTKHIPHPLADLLWRALTDVPRTSLVLQDLTTELASPPTLAEFQRALHGHQGSTTPGATGLTYNMAKGWPDPVTHYVHQCLLHLWNQQQTPGWLQWSWLCPKPKNLEEEVTLDGLRPLRLLEVIRKLWTGIIVGRITRAWERHRVLATAQQGFRPGRGTDTALIQFINAREHAEETNTPLYTSSWDIRRAFDSVSREAMELGWTRLGVPPQIAGWLAGMDVGGATAIRSPWALQSWWQHQYEGFRTTPSMDGPNTFQRERGTPQGDITSPHNWTSFFDIALRALELDARDPTSPAHIPASAVRPAGHRVSELAYADDLVSMAHTRAGLQRKADIISAFTTLFDMEISVGKLRLAVFGPTPLPATDPAQADTLLIHGARTPSKCSGCSSTYRGPKPPKSQPQSSGFSGSAISSWHNGRSTTPPLRPRSAHSPGPPTQLNSRRGQPRTSRT